MYIDFDPQKYLELCINELLIIQRRFISFEYMMILCIQISQIAR